MPLDHELHSIANDLGPSTQSAFDAKDRPADRAPSADAVPRPSESSLIPCVYIALRCSLCGELRQVLDALPGFHTVICPECGRTCGFVLLGFGLTKQQLPFHEVLGAERTHWAAGDEDPSDETDETNDSS
jgi:hypothetical protein